MDCDWDKMQELAMEEVEATLEALPAPLREKAKALPVTFHPRPSAELVDDGIEPDTLGLFTGSEHAFEEISPLPLPPQIMLFLENLWEFADQDEELFLDEVHTTYMHELGHYLGLDEDDLFDRGLE